MYSGGGWRALLGGAMVGVIASASGPVGGVAPMAVAAVPVAAVPAPVPEAGTPATSAAARFGRAASDGRPELASAAAGPASDEMAVVPPPPPVDPPVDAPVPAPVVDRPLPSSGVAPAGGTWAVVIGIDDYPGRLSDLRSAVNDATDMTLALGTLGVPPERRLVLRNGEATAAAIGAAADWLVARAGPDASAAFFYSGHVRKIGPGVEALIGADGVVVADADLAARLAGLAARQTWIAIAGCYGAGFTELLGPGRILTGAAAANALAFESSLYNRSYLGQFMIREAIVEGRAAGSVQAAFAYANRQLAARHPGRQLVQLDHLGTALDLRPLAAAASAVLSPPPPPPEVSPPAPAPVAALPPPPRNCLLLILCASG